MPKKEENPNNTAMKKSPKVFNRINLYGKVWVLVLRRFGMEMLILLVSFFAFTQLDPALLVFEDYQGFTGKSFLFLFFALVWMHSIWFISRLKALALYNWMKDFQDREHIAQFLQFVRWIPPIFAFAGGLIYCLAFLMRDTGPGTIVQAVLPIVLFGGYFFGANKLRLPKSAYFFSREITSEEEETGDSRKKFLGNPNVRRIWWFLFLGYVLVLLISIRPFHGYHIFTAIFNPISSLMVSFGMLSFMVGSVLLYDYKKDKSLRYVFLGLLLLGSYTSDNDRVRQLSFDVGSRKSIHDFAQEWLGARIPEVNEQSYPVYLIAGQGGGSRASYWMYNVLDKLNRETATPFFNHTFSICSASGSSMGAGWALAKQYFHPDEALSAKQESCYSDAVASDFLTPTNMALGFSEIVQQFIPFWGMESTDRSKVVEMHMQKTFLQAVGQGGCNKMEEGFVTTQKSSTKLLPLFLPLTSHQSSGQSVVMSPVHFNSLPDDLYRPLDFFSHAKKDIPWNTAMLLSARFPLFTSPGRVCLDSAIVHKGKRWKSVHLVDGGYAENTGVDFSLSLAQVLRKVAEEMDRKIDIRLLIVTNSQCLFDQPDGDKGQADFHQLKLMSTPLISVFSAWGGYGEKEYRVVADRSRGTEAFDSIQFVSFQHEYKDIPLTRYLSRSARSAMDRELDSLFYGKQNVLKFPAQGVIQDIKQNLKP